MARTVLQQSLAVYYCCCAMAMLHLTPGVFAAVAGGVLERQQAAADGGHDTISRAAATGDGAASPAARNKRWSTTFGANSSNKNVTNNNANRDCSTDSDCLDTPDTSCGFDTTDRKKRCLCADGKQPLNGDCAKKPRGPLFFPALRTSCETDVECLPNAVCKSNATTTNNRLKICMCKDGFTEEKDACNNYADILNFNYTTLLIAVFTSWIWNDSRV